MLFKESKLKDWRIIHKPIITLLILTTNQKSLFMDLKAYVLTFPLTFLLKAFYFKVTSNCQKANNISEQLICVRWVVLWANSYACKTSYFRAILHNKLTNLTNQSRIIFYAFRSSSTIQTGDNIKFWLNINMYQYAATTLNKRS